ncbi:MAG: TonB-dependent receptor [Candidatus Methylopumilus sp.]|nr:TonB-dependent receptor [Candidatus Methylopumilus sp.]
MNKSIFACLLGLAFSNITLAAEDINLKDVIVVASRVAQSPENVIGDVTVINREEIERAGQSTFIELLQAQPGIEISSKGGAGQQSSVFLRGTNSNQVVVLIDGMRIGSATTGSTAFANLPLAQIDRIEILRGLATSLYGQDAVGGVIQIFTKQGTGSPQFNAAVGYGSYNTEKVAAGFSGSVEKTQFSLAVSQMHTNGFSALKSSGSIDKDKDAYRNLAVSASLSRSISEGHDLGLQILSSDGRNHYDSGFNTYSNYDDMSAVSYSLFSKNQMTANWKSSLRIGQGTDDDNSHFADGAFGVSQYKTKQKQLSWQNDIALSLGSLNLVYDRLEQKLISNSNPVFNQTKRNSDGFLIAYLATINDHSVQGNLRNDHSNQFGSHTTGSLGYGYKLTSNWRITGSYGTAFKAPTFNDLYYPDDGWGPYSDPNLKSEKSKNFEASLRYQENDNELSATLYKNKIANFIALDQNYFPVNVNAEITGLTVAASQHWDDWQLKTSLDIQSPENDDTGKLLPLRARRHGVINLGKSWGKWNVASELIASSARYNDADNTTRISPYAIVNLTADYKIDDSWRLQGRVNNLLDKNYALAYSGSTPYNTPGANVFVSLVWLAK